MTDCERIRIHRNEHNKFAAMMGIYTEEIRPGYAKGEMTIRPEFENAIQSVHGGCLFTLADTICGAAAASYGWKMTTMSSDIHYLKAAIGTKKLYAEATEVKSGKNVCIYEVLITDDKGNENVKGTFTFFNLKERLLPEEDEA